MYNMSANHDPEVLTPGGSVHVDTLHRHLLYCADERRQPSKVRYPQQSVDSGWQDLVMWGLATWADPGADWPDLPVLTDWGKSAVVILRNRPR